LRWRLMASFILVALAAIAGVVFFVRQDTADQVVTYLFRGGIYGMENLVKDLENYYQENDTWDGVEPLLVNVNTPGSLANGNRRGQGMMGKGLHLQLADDQGIVLYDSYQLDNGKKLPDTTLDSAVLLENAVGDTVGWLVIEGGGAAMWGDEKPILESLDQAALRSGLIAVGIALILATLLASGLLVPIQNLTRAAEKMSTGDLNQRVKTHGNNELAILGNSFNTMAESLQKSEQRKRAMTADIAHELRTPLSVQRAQIEAMLDGVNSFDADNLQMVLDQNEQLARLVDDLRTLALADAGELRLEQTIINLVEHVGRIVSRFQAAAGNRALVLNSPASKVTINGDPARIEQILTNVIGNAIRYTPQGGKINISIETGKHDVSVKIHDGGTGIPAGEVEKIFERFYRVERSRSRDAGGTGLGLAIARQLAIAHGGNLTAANHPEGGAVFTLTLLLAG
jgi:two-component system sensor histidine kinase BaeS